MHKKTAVTAKRHGGGFNLSFVEWNSRVFAIFSRVIIREKTKSFFNNPPGRIATVRLNRRLNNPEGYRTVGKRGPNFPATYRTDGQF